MNEKTVPLAVLHPDTCLPRRGRLESDVRALLGNPRRVSGASRRSAWPSVLPCSLPSPRISINDHDFHVCASRIEEYERENGERRLKAQVEAAENLGTSMSGRDCAWDFGSGETCSLLSFLLRCAGFREWRACMRCMNRSAVLLLNESSLDSSRGLSFSQRHGSWKKKTGIPDRRCALCSFSRCKSEALTQNSYMSAKA